MRVVQDVNSGAKAAKVVMVGNGTYLNRGCEAIVRGSLRIIREGLGNEARVTVGSFGPPEEVKRQAQREAYDFVRHFPLSPAWSDARRGSLGRIVTGGIRRVLRAIGFEPDVDTRRLGCELDGSCCVLEVGGDNYSLDYGIPHRFVSLDRRVQRYGIPLILWGASVGPFDAMPEFASKMFAHLRSLSGIFVRESLSREYLRANGVEDNVWLVADPGFLLEPTAPTSLQEQPPDIAGSVGVNLSPLIGKYLGLARSQWVTLAGELVTAIAESTGRSLVLVPHVVSRGNSDHEFLTSVHSLLPQYMQDRVWVSSADLNAAETKWLISQCEVFIGARTHSTIAALSSCVPTLSLAYSQKARGINLDVFGSSEYCIESSSLTPVAIGRSVKGLLANATQIRNHLEKVIPTMKERALSAGTLLRETISVSG